METQTIKGFTTMQFIIAALLFSGVIGLIFLAVGSLSTTYDTPGILDDDFSDKFDNFEADRDRAGSMWDRVSGEDGLSLVGSVEILFFSTFQVIGLIFGAVTAAGTSMFGFAEYFGVNSEVAGIFFALIFSILTVIVIFKILSFVKGSGRDL